MKRVFMSVPMHDRKLDDINKDIRAAIQAFSKYKGLDIDGDEFEFINTMQTGPGVSVPYERVWYLGKAIEKLATCDLVIFCEGWHRADGCRVENYIADTYDIPRYQYKDGKIVPMWNERDYWD